MSAAPAHNCPRNTVGAERAAPDRYWGAALPLLSFGAGAADGFAYLVLGGIFTANMTGNAVLATMYGRPTYPSVLVGALTAIVAFACALVAGFGLTREQQPGSSRKALLASALCHVVVVLIWWQSTRSRTAVLCLIAASAAAMALQTVATKRDGVPSGATTTYATGTLTDILKDVVDGHARWYSARWLSLFALPTGAVFSVAVSRAWPALTPVIPLTATTACLMLVSLRSLRSPPVASLRA